MQFLFPWALLSLLPIGAAAFWAIARPMQKVMPVGSLRLWERAVESLGPAARKSRRLTVAWWLLLAGAAAAAVAMARPIYYAESPARRIGVAIYPSAELAGVPEGTLAEITGAFLRRLAPTDRVRLILPTPWGQATLGGSARLTTGGMSDFISPDEAARRVGGMHPLPATAEDLTLPVTDQDVQHTYRFAPATLKTEDGPGITTIALPARPGDVTIDAFAVETVNPASSSPQPSVQIFVAVRNHTDKVRQGAVCISGEVDRSWVTSTEYNLPPSGRQSLIIDPLASEYYSAGLVDVAGPGASAYAVRRSRTTVDVAIVGRSEPLVRRFVQKNPALRLIDDPAGADAVIAVGADAPADIPAVVIDPPEAPAGWRRGKLLENIALRDADTLTDHPILAHVDLSAVAVRRSVGWLPVETPGQERLVSIGADALVLAGTNPPRVWVAFDPATENTNFAMTESFVVFLANVFKYLAPQVRPNVSWESVSPLSAGPRRDWKPLETGQYSPPAPGDDDPLPWPGLYRDGSGEIHAVSLTGLKSAAPETDPLKRIAEISLPEPQPLTQGRELWPFLALAAAMLWLGGWVLRMR